MTIPKPIALVIVIVGVGLFGLAAIENVYTTPAHAIVYVDRLADDLTYFAPPCLVDPHLARKVEAGTLQPQTKEYVRELGYRPDPDCVETGAFTQDGRNGLGMILQMLGMLEPIESRWNADGSWNW